MTGNPGCILLPEEFMVEKDFKERAILNTSGFMVSVGALRSSYLGPHPKEEAL